MPVIVVLPTPGLETCSVQLSGVPEQETLEAETVAVLVKLPMSPKTNPATDVAATIVMAIRMTVASTGEIPFLLLTFIGSFLAHFR